MKNFERMILVVTMLFVYTPNLEAANDVNIRPYTKAEQKMLEETIQYANEITGLIDDYQTFIVTKESLLNWSTAVDYWNPLFYSEKYADNTKWNGIIAAPFYTDRYNIPYLMGMQYNSEVGNWGGTNDGGGMEWYLPIRIGDTFRIYNMAPIIEDITKEAGPRTFKITCQSKLINQNNEDVCRAYVNLTNSFTPGELNQDGAMREHREGEPDRPDPYIYSNKELEKFKTIEDNEIIRGSEVLYWEDVKLNDRLNPVITGPTTVIDMIQFAAHEILNAPTMREFRNDKNNNEVVVDTNTNVTHIQAEGHFVDLSGKGSTGIHFAAYSRSLLARLVTNWMGDDGILRSFEWKNFQDGKEYLKEIEEVNNKKALHHEMIGDTIIANGIVVNKRVVNDKHIVDIIAWIENQKDEVGTAGKISVELCSKNNVQKK